MLPRYSAETDSTVSGDCGSAMRPDGRRIDAHHLDDDRRDVIESTPAVRLGDEGGQEAAGPRSREQDLLQPGVVHHPRESVTGEEEDVPRLHLALVDVR